MADFPISYDPKSNTIKLDGPDGATVILAFLLKAKFGEAFDPEVLLHEQLANVMSELRENASWAASVGANPQGPFTQESLHQIANAILGESFRSGWWGMSREERAAYVREVAAAPHSISVEQVETVLLGVDDGLFRWREIVEAADRGEVC